LQVGTLLIDILGAAVYWRASRRRRLVPATASELIAVVDL
jgi:hypothetical protein